MSAELLRRAADVARTRGECADCGVAGNDLCDSCNGTGRRSGGRCHDCLPVGSGTVECPTCAGTGTNTEEPDAHVHLAVADWLDSEADDLAAYMADETLPFNPDRCRRALAVARAYLGESS